MHEGELCCHLLLLVLVLLHFGMLLLGGRGALEAEVNRQHFPPIYLSYMFSSSSTLPGTDYILPQMYILL